MIARKSARAIEIMRRAGRIVAETLQRIRERALVDVTTEELDGIAVEHIRRSGAVPLFKGYRVGRLVFPSTICISVNEEVVHGMPGARRLADGDIVSVDVGARIDGYCGDAATTVGVGNVDESGRRLIEVCREALTEGVAAARVGARLSDIGRAVQQYVESRGCSVVREYTGHGIGREMHEPPQVPNFVTPRMEDLVLFAGMTLAIEPMVNEGGAATRVLENGWTVVTADGSRSAHWEHTVAVGATGGDILTLP